MVLALSETVLLNGSIHTFILQVVYYKALYIFLVGFINMQPRKSVGVGPGDPEWGSGDGDTTMEVALWQ